MQLVNTVGDSADALVVIVSKHGEQPIVYLNGEPYVLGRLLAPLLRDAKRGVMAELS